MATNPATKQVTKQANQTINQAAKQERKATKQANEAARKATKQANEAAKAEAKANKGKLNYATEGTRYLDAQQAILDKTIGLESQFRPQFGAQNLADIGQYSAGLQDILGQSTRTAQDQLSASKAAEIESMTSLTGKTRSFLNSMSPEGAARVQQAQTQAAQAQGLAGLYQGQSQGYINQANTLGNEAFARRGYLSQEQMRNADQQARAGAQAAGRIGGNLGIASEVLNRENALAARRGEATTAGLNALNQFQAQQGTMGNLRGEAQNANTNAFEMGSNFYTQPGLNLLGQPSQAYNAGQQANVYGMGLLGQSTPQMINPDTGINLAMAERQDATAKRNAQLQAGATKSAGNSAMIGSMAGAGVAIGAVLI